MLVNPELLRAFAGQVDHATAAMSGVNVDGTVLGSVLTVLVVATVTALSLGLPAQELLTASMRKNPSRLGRRRPECSDSRRAPSPKSLATLVTTDTFSGSLARAGGWPGSMCPLDGVPFLRSSSVGRTVLYLRQDRDPAKPSRAWVVDAEHGSMLFDGPSDLRLSQVQDQPLIEQRGNYAVATVNGETTPRSHSPSKAAPIPRPPTWCSRWRTARS
jgi:hypothetical protein